MSLIKYKVKCDVETIEEKNVKVWLKNADGKTEVLEMDYDEYFRTYCNKNELDKLVEPDKITMENKMKITSPYNIFFNVLKLVPETQEQENAISFQDLLCPSLGGKLKSVLHITTFFNLEWVLKEYAKKKLHTIQITVIYGWQQNNIMQFFKQSTLKDLYPKIDCNFIKMEDEFGLHHSKLIIHLYEDNSLRIIIGSSETGEEAWTNKNNLFWISPACPALPKGSSVFDGESISGFKFSLLDYLRTYSDKNIATLAKWIEIVEQTDFSNIQVALIFSSPGVQYPRKNGSHLHYLGHVLSKDCIIPAPKEEHDSWRIVAQTTSLGRLGLDPEEWLTTHLLKSLGSSVDNPYLASLWDSSKIKFSLIFPSIKNCLNAYGGLKMATGLYQANVRKLQPWLENHMCQWKANKLNRSRFYAYYKCYARISPCWKKMAYFLLTSANVSRAAWGKIPQQNTAIYQRSYELGILFLPKYFGEEYFEVMETLTRRNKKLFPILFDLPLTEYGPNDESYCMSVCVKRGLVSLEDILASNSEDSDDELCENLENTTLENQLERNVEDKNEPDLQPRTDNLFFPSFTKN